MSVQITVNMTSKKRTTRKRKNDAAEKLTQGIIELLEHTMKHVQEDIDSLSPKERLSFFLQFTEFILPKLSCTSLEDELDTTDSGLRSWIITPVEAPKYED